MIPGTLRPLPKRVKELKDKSDSFLPKLQVAEAATDDIYTNSKSYSFEQIKTHYELLNRYYNDILPLVKNSEKVLNKYINDELLNEYVFNLRNKLIKARDRLLQDIQRLETMLMARRKSYIEKRIPFIKQQISEKLAFMKELSFEEIIKHGEEYSKIITEIVNDISTLRDEYTKLLEGSFDVSTFYSYLDEGIVELESEIQEYEFILRTCKMELYSNNGNKLIEEGEKIKSQFEKERTYELLNNALSFIDRSNNLLEEMSTIKVTKPKKGISKDFIKQFERLRKRFEKVRDTLSIITSEISERAEELETYIEQINGLKELNEKGEMKFSEVLKALQIKKVGSFKLALKENDVPYMSLTEDGIVKLNIVELTPKIIDIIIEKLTMINEEKFFDNLKAYFKTLDPKKMLESTKSKLKAFGEKVTKITKKLGGKVKELGIKAKEKAKNVKRRKQKEKTTQDTEPAEVQN